MDETVAQQGASWLCRSFRQLGSAPAKTSTTIPLSTVEFTYVSCCRLFNSSRRTQHDVERATYQTSLEPLRNQMQFAVQPYFDQGDMWTVGFLVTSPAGETGELTTQVESTPPGYGAWDLAIYLFPFLLLGGIWAVAMVRRSRTAAMQATQFDGPRPPSTDNGLAGGELVESETDDRR